jgi:hypothetical protein
MNPSRTATHRRRPAWVRRALGGAWALALAFSLALPALAAEEPAPSGLTIEARALMAGHVRPGMWSAISVEVANDGPAISGELRVRGPQQGRSLYGIPVELPGTSRQVFTLYAQPPLFGSRVHVDLVSGTRTLLTVDVPIRSHDAYAPIYAVLAERPEGLMAGVNLAAREQRAPFFEGSPATVISIDLADLPPRVEAWSAIDRLVWQDVDPRRLSTEQLEALRLWLGAGGRLVVVGGTTGLGTVSGFPEDLLPFIPRATVDVPVAELASVLGRAPSGITSVPALGGMLRQGSAWARSGEDVIAAHSTIGQGAVTLLGINPAEPWLADTEAGRALWRRLLPAATGPRVSGLGMADDSMLVGVLNMLPSIDLPPIEQLFLLLFAYVALIGPVNYVVLRRLDRREWAWVTMPALVAIFALGSYGMGATLKGSDVIVNEVAIIHAAERADRGLSQVYVGIYSPTRRTFDVRVADGALLANPTSQGQFGQSEQPLDVLFGEKSRLRDFQVGFGVLRSFRAQAATAAPTIESSLRLTQGRIHGTVTNRSEAALENVAVTYAGGVAVLDRLEAGASADVNIDTSRSFFAHQLSERIFGSSRPRDEAQERRVFTRRTVIDQLTAYGSQLVGTTDGPVLLAWRPGPVLDVELVGEEPNRVGDSLVLVPLAMALDREAVFTDAMISRTMIQTTGDGYVEGTSFSLGRGAMTVELRPAVSSGAFAADSLEIALTQGEARSLRGDGTPIAPLPDAQQPDQEDPLTVPDGSDEPANAFTPLPNVQLLEHATGLWYEFPRFVSGRSYLIEEPARFVDSNGRVLARLVNRGRLNDGIWFTLVVRLGGTIE